MRIILFLFTLLVTSFSTQKDRTPVQTCVKVSETANSITVRCTGFGKEKVDAMNAAELYAVQTILFRGIPDTKHSKPLAGIDETALHKKYPQYFKELFTNNRYKTYITCVSPVVNYLRDKQYKLWKISADITINISALKQDLENQGVIRRFGY